jgi:hypothetical protein
MKRAHYERQPTGGSLGCARAVPGHSEVAEVPWPEVTRGEEKVTDLDIRVEHEVERELDLQRGK